MLTVFSLLFITFYLALWFIEGNRRRQQKWLPGPPLMPFIGGILYALPYFRPGRHNYEMFQAGFKKYGPVFGIKFGTNYSVVVEDLKVAKEIMNDENWKNRYNDHPMFYEKTFNQQIGLLFGNGDNWKEIRKFSIRKLRQFGFGKGSTLESSLSRELEDLFKFLTVNVDHQENSCAVVNMHQFFSISVLNIIWKLISGTRFSHEDTKMKKILNRVNEMAMTLVQGTTPLHAFPFLRYIPGLTEQEFELKVHQEVGNIIRQTMSACRNKGSYISEPTTFIEAFLKEIDTRRNQENFDTKNYYTDEELICSCKDLFLAGSDSSSVTLEWAFLFMILNPQVQRKIQEEIDQTCGIGKESQPPSLDDRKKMTYTEATILEILRMGSVLPLTGRTPKIDSHINGHYVPKGTMVGIILHAIHYSTKIWDDPTVFRPERFISSDNKIINTDKILPFGTGTRFCMGVLVARATIFTIFTAILQKYSFERAPGDENISSEKSISGIVRYPVPYRALIKLRRQ